MGGHRSRSRPRRRDACRRRAQQHRHQCVARSRSGHRRTAGGRGRPVAGVHAECPVVYRHTGSAAAVAARASQEHAARGAFPERHSRRHALRHARARPASRAHSRQRLFRVRRRHVVAVSADRAAGAGARPGDLRAAANLHWRRRGIRRGFAAPVARGGLARHPCRGGERPLRAGRARVGVRAEHRASGGRDARHGRCVDIDPFGAAGLGAIDAAGMGARTRTGSVRGHPHGRHGAGQHPVGPGGDAGRHSGRADHGGRRHAGRHRVDVAIQAGPA